MLLFPSLKFGFFSLDPRLTSVIMFRMKSPKTFASSQRITATMAMTPATPKLNVAMVVSMEEEDVLKMIKWLAGGQSIVLVGRNESACWLCVFIRGCC